MDPRNMKIEELVAWIKANATSPDFQTVQEELLRRCKEEGQTGETWQALENAADDKRLGGGDWGCQRVVQAAETRFGWRSTYRATEETMADLHPR